MVLRSSSSHTFEGVDDLSQGGRLREHLIRARRSCSEAVFAGEALGSTPRTSENSLFRDVGWVVASPLVGSYILAMI